MICVLKGTDPDSNVCELTKKGHHKLIDFREALKRCQDSSYMNASGFTNVLKLSEHQKRALDYIHNTFRNNFLHYRPAMWFIELAGLPGIITHGLDIIALVTVEMGSYPAHYDRNRIRALVAEGKSALLKFQAAGTRA